MSGSKKGRKLRPYRSGGASVYLHVLLMTAEDAAWYEWEYGPTTQEMLDWPIDPPAAAAAVSLPGDEQP